MELTLTKEEIETNNLEHAEASLKEATALEAACLLTFSVSLNSPAPSVFVHARAGCNKSSDIAFICRLVLDSIESGNMTHTSSDRVLKVSK